jgi:LPXTG-motif cell wall-anchored protein
MKRLITIVVFLAVFLSSALPASAADSKAVYSGNAGNFVFEPGSEHSLTDLFANFKGVMPGDTITQKITVKNDANDKVKVKIYMRSLGAHEDSAEFLSKLGLKVQKSEENQMAYMFDAAANETAQLTDWVYLGMLYSGGEVNLDVTLTVPVELDNAFQNKIGYLDWEFRIEEFPAEPDDPQPPQTGDATPLGLWIGGLVASASVMIILLITKKKHQQTS